MDRLDLLISGIRAPLVDAVCATVCDRWREAADLWLDVCRVLAYRPLAAACGLEASLHAGLYDLSQYFQLHVDGSPAAPDFLAEPWRRSLTIRRNRARFYSSPAGNVSTGDARGEPRRLADLHLYREAIHLFRRDRQAAIPLLTECYFALGEHEALLALHRTHREYFVDRDVQAMLASAENGLARAAMGPVENTEDFLRRHPMGARLAPLLASPSPAAAAHE
jgi:hypothetical protein